MARQRIVKFRNHLKAPGGDILAHPCNNLLRPRNESAAQTLQAMRSARALVVKSKSNDDTDDVGSVLFSDEMRRVNGETNVSNSYYVQMHEPSEDLYLLAYGEAHDLVAAMRIDVQEACDYFEQPGSLLVHDLLDVARSFDGEETVEWAREEPDNVWSDALRLKDILRMVE